MVRRRAAAVWLHSLELVFEVSQLAHDFSQLSLALIFLDRAFTDTEHPFFVYEIASSRSAGIFAVDTFPVLLEIGLDVLEAVEGRHLGWLFLGGGGSLAGQSSLDGT